MTPALTYTVGEAAAMLGVSRGVGYEAARRGDLPTIRLGRRLLVPKAVLDRMLGVAPDHDVAPAGNGREVTTPAGQGRRDAS